MNDDYMQEMELQRYADALAAIKECVEKNISPKSIATLKFECGIDNTDLRLIIEQAFSGEIKVAKNEQP